MIEKPQCGEIVGEVMTLVYSAPEAICPPPPHFSGELGIYVGNSQSPNELDLLEGNRVASVLNVAYDVDDIPPRAPVRRHGVDRHRPSPPLPPGAPAPVLYDKQQFAKVGLIDGTGNPSGIMGLAAAVYMAEQMFEFPPKDAVDPPLEDGHTYPRGNLLVHCYGGGSRSVTVASLYVWYKFGVALGDSAVRVPGRSDRENFLAQYNRVKNKRGVGLCPGAQPGTTEPPPTYGMQEAALKLVDTYSALFPLPVPR